MASISYFFIFLSCFFFSTFCPAVLSATFSGYVSISSTSHSTVSGVTDCRVITLSSGTIGGTVGASTAAYAYLSTTYSVTSTQAVWIVIGIKNPHSAVLTILNITST
jgi:hypothetical protein